MLFDSEWEEDFDEIICFVIMLLNVFILLVFLVDEYWQWFKLVFGLDVCEILCEYVFCLYVILLFDNIFVVWDSDNDLWFFDNLFVIGYLWVKVYVGVLFVMFDGMLLGMLCVIDIKFCEFSELDL